MILFSKHLNWVNPIATLRSISHLTVWRREGLVDGGRWWGVGVVDGGVGVVMAGWWMAGWGVWMEGVVGGGGGRWQAGVNEQSRAGLCLGQTSHPEPWFY